MITELLKRMFEPVFWFLVNTNLVRETSWVQNLIWFFFKSQVVFVKNTDRFMIFCLNSTGSPCFTEWNKSKQCCYLWIPVWVISSAGRFEQGMCCLPTPCWIWQHSIFCYHGPWKSEQYVPVLNISFHETVPKSIKWSSGNSLCLFAILSMEEVEDQSFLQC